MAAAYGGAAGKPNIESTSLNDRVWPTGDIQQCLSLIVERTVGPVWPTRVEVAVIVTARLITTISRSSDQVAPLRHPRPAFGSAALKIAGRNVRCGRLQSTRPTSGNGRARTSIVAHHFFSTLADNRRTLLVIEPLSQSDRANSNSCLSD
jgi:hypothetical protein